MLKMLLHDSGATMSKTEIEQTQSGDALQVCRGQPCPHAGMVGRFCGVIRIKGALQGDTSKPRSKKRFLNDQDTTGRKQL